MEERILIMYGFQDNSRHLCFSRRDGMYFYQALSWYAVHHNQWFDDEAFELADEIARLIERETILTGFALRIRDNNFNILIAAVEEWQEYLDKIDKNEIRLRMREDLTEQLRSCERSLARQDIMEEMYV